MSTVAIRCASMSTGVLLFFCGCADPAVTGLPPEATRVGHEEVDTLAREYYSGVTERRREVIRSETEWAAFWGAIYATLSPEPPLPLVDFDESVVVTASMGVESSGGYSIDVTDVYRTPSGLHVVVRETSPGPSCFTTAALTQPVVAVRIPRVDGAITFVERESVHECS